MSRVDEWSGVEAGLRDEPAEALGMPAVPITLREPETVEIDDRDRLLEWSDLSRALDIADDVMMSRGHRTPSWSNEEYAAAVRAALRLLMP